MCAKFQAGSKAIYGGPVYLSDNVGSHDFDLIKKLVFLDGKISDKFFGHEHVVTDFVWWDIISEFVWRISLRLFWVT